MKFFWLCYDPHMLPISFTLSPSSDNAPLYQPPLWFKYIGGNARFLTGRNIMVNFLTIMPNLMDVYFFKIIEMSSNCVHVRKRWFMCFKIWAFNLKKQKWKLYRHSDMPICYFIAFLFKDNKPLTLLLIQQYIVLRLGFFSIWSEFRRICCLIYQLSLSLL